MAFPKDRENLTIFPPFQTERASFEAHRSGAGTVLVDHYLIRSSESYFSANDMTPRWGEMSERVMKCKVQSIVNQS